MQSELENDNKDPSEGPGRLQYIIIEEYLGSWKEWERVDTPFMDGTQM